MLSKVLETHPPNTIGGYDIGCSFTSTVKRSSLKNLFEEKKARLCVNAFHGYSHSYLCQLKFHPSIIRGMGLEDLETMERIFSSSNQLASVIRYASSYRRRLFIEAFFKQWDADKYQNLGTFILRNYQQALEIIRDNTFVIEQAKTDFGITDAEMDQWEQEEQSYFAQLGKEQEYDILAVTYVDLLQQLKKLDDKRSSATSQLFDIITPETMVSYDEMNAESSKLETQREQAIERYERLDIEIRTLEAKMDIDRVNRWTPATPQYVEALKYMNERNYRRALDKLQMDVVLRLFELHKLNLSQTGE